MFCYRFFSSEDKFIKSAGYSIGIFNSVVHKLVLEPKKDEPAGFAALRRLTEKDMKEEEDEKNRL